LSFGTLLGILFLLPALLADGLRNFALQDFSWKALPGNMSNLKTMRGNVFVGPVLATCSSNLPKEFVLGTRTSQFLGTSSLPPAEGLRIKGHVFFTQNYTEKILHAEAFAQRGICTEQLFDKSFCTQTVFHAGAFTHRSICPDNFSTE